MRQSMTSDWKILRNFGNQHLKLLILRSVVVAVGDFKKMPFACIVWDIPISKTSIGLDPNSRRDRVNLLTTIKGVLKKDQSTKKQHLLS